MSSVSKAKPQNLSADNLSDSAPDNTNHVGLPTQPGISTLAVHAGEQRQKALDGITDPIILASTYTFENTQSIIDYIEQDQDRGEYGRYGVPGEKVVERKLAALEGAEEGILFSTGMAAFVGLLNAKLKTGDEIVFFDECYHRSRDYCRNWLSRYGVVTREVKTGDYDAMESAINDKTRFLVSESPTNPHQSIIDLERFATIGKKYGIETVIDATLATPYNLQPISWGVDYVMHSATKYLGGHNDLLAGVVLGASEKPGVMIDVGAHLGSSLLPFAKAGWSVLAFEPDQVNRKGLMERVANYPDVHVSDNAVGKEAAAEVAFYRSDVSSGISSLTAFHESHQASERVVVTTLDDVISTAGLTELDFLKIDVEGHEMDVLDGFDLGQVRPRAIMLEFEDGKAVRGSHLLEALAGRLLAHKYHVYVSEWHQVVEYGHAHDWRQMVPYPAVLADGSWGNLIAFRKPPSVEELDIALSQNLSSVSTGISSLATLSRLAPKPGPRQRMLTWLARKAPWLRILWRSFKGVAPR